MRMTFGDRDLHTLWVTGRSKGIRADLQGRARRVLRALDAAATMRDLAPAFRTHPLPGTVPLRHSMWVSAQWRITFVVGDGVVTDLQLEQYH
jgi:plasmid maintenance system killer protein